MAAKAYLRIKNHPIKSGRMDLAYRGWLPMQAVEFEYGVTSPNEASGKQTGRRIHDTVKVVKFVDRTTPLILQALCKTEKCELEFVMEGSARGRDGRPQTLRCHVEKAIYVRRKYKPPPKGAGRDHLGTEEYIFRCTGLVFDTKRVSDK